MTSVFVERDTNQAGGTTSPEAHRVRFQNTNPDDEDEQARLRRGSVSKDLRNQIALRGMIGRIAVSQGYATDRIFSRSRSEASIFRPDPKPDLEPPADEVELDNPSNTLWKSRYTQLNRVKSTSSVISGLNDDVLRAGWRRNEPGPYWENSRELDPDRQAIVEVPEVEEQDGFDIDEMDFEDEVPDTSPSASNDLASLIQDENVPESLDQLGKMNSSKFKLSASNPTNPTGRLFGKTKSMPVGGSFGTRPEQQKFHREFDPTFMRMDVEF